MIIPWVTAFSFYEESIADKLNKEGYSIKFLESPDAAINELIVNKYRAILIDPEFHVSFDNDDDFKERTGIEELKNAESYSRLWIVGKYIIERTRESINKETPILIIDYFSRLNVEATSQCIRAGATRYIRDANIETIINELDYYTKRYL